MKGGVGLPPHPACPAHWPQQEALGTALAWESQGLVLALIPPCWVTLRYCPLSLPFVRCRGFHSIQRCAPHFTVPETQPALSVAAPVPSWAGFLCPCVGPHLRTQCGCSQLSGLWSHSPRCGLKLKICSEDKWEVCRSLNEIT